MALQTFVNLTVDGSECDNADQFYDTVFSAYMKKSFASFYCQSIENNTQMESLYFEEILAADNVPVDDLSTDVFFTENNPSTNSFITDTCDGNNLITDTNSLTSNCLSLDSLTDVDSPHTNSFVVDSPSMITLTTDRMFDTNNPSKNCFTTDSPSSNSLTTDSSSEEITKLPHTESVAMEHGLTSRNYVVLGQEATCNNNLPASDKLQVDQCLARTPEATVNQCEEELLLLGQHEWDSSDFPPDQDLDAILARYLVEEVITEPEALKTIHNELLPQASLPSHCNQHLSRVNSSKSSQGDIRSRRQRRRTPAGSDDGAGPRRQRRRTPAGSDDGAGPRRQRRRTPAGSDDGAGPRRQRLRTPAGSDDGAGPRRQRRRTPAGSDDGAGPRRQRRRTPAGSDDGAGPRRQRRRTPAGSDDVAGPRRQRRRTPASREDDAESRRQRRQASASKDDGAGPRRQRRRTPAGRDDSVRSNRQRRGTSSSTNRAKSSNPTEMSQRSRELNNIASRSYRQRRRQNILNMKEELRLLEEKNISLRRKFEKLKKVTDHLMKVMKLGVS
nr:pre-mRNA-splicing factor CWC22 homolog isoform X2 [Procambarus clarkii]